MQGSQESGRVIVPGEGVGSVMVDLIESGDMPRDGAPVTPQELATLIKWINQGAKFDGRDPNQPLRELARVPGGATPPDATPTALPEPAPLKRATGNETVSFALDIAPILTARCGECHIGDNVRGGLSLATFSGLLQGGDSGAIIGRGDPEASLLVRKLRGTAGQRMPLNRPPLDDEQIALIATWIRDGSKFDGGDPTEPLERTTAMVRADRATSDELSQIRAELATQNWRLALPDEQPHQAITARFLLVGNVPEPQLRQWGEVAELQAAQVQKVLRRPADEALSKGRITLFVFATPIDFGEFATMVEERKREKAERGSWAYDIVDAYACVLPMSDDSEASANLFAQQIAALSLAERGRGRLPAWLVEGAARATAAKLAPRDPRIAMWQERLPLAVAELKQPDDFLRGKLSPEATAVLAYGFVGPLMRNERNFDRLVELIAAGDTVDVALKTVYRHNAAELARLWLASLSRGRR
jgi:hypothetical protein